MIENIAEKYSVGALLYSPALNGKVADAVIDKTGGSYLTPSTPSTGSSGEDEIPVAPSTGSSSLFQTVRFTNGTTVTGTVGTEILWRIGTATCVASGNPGLIDVTTGEAIASGDQLRANHLYIISMAEGRGFKCTSDVVILIKGPYTAN